MAASPRQKKKDALCDLLAGISESKEIAALLDDLCTLKEIENMAERLFTAKLLMEGYTYNQIMEQAEISSATLSRVSRCVQHGKGYSRLVQVNGKWKMESGK